MMMLMGKSPVRQSRMELSMAAITNNYQTNHYEGKSLLVGPGHKEGRLCHPLLLLDLPLTQPILLPLPLPQVGVYDISGINYQKPIY